jgi:alkanesulfonate monooxygenase SsuD/methylene tetrahydromethanopterin reductase-like flavin-dependent oxidoreductase (luciferase family)
MPGERPLRVGIQLPEVEREVRWPEYREMAVRAEAAGFDTIWLGDHLLYRWPDRESRGPWEVWTMLAGLAAATTRIGLGPLVASTAFHAPAMLAKLAATVDEVSQGRLVLGLGAGWNETEFGAFGFPYDHRIDRFEEAFTIIRRLLAGERVDLDGRYNQLDGAEILPRPRPGGPPLLIGSIGPRMLRITLPHVQAWNVWYSETRNTPAGLEPLLRQVDEACRDVGRDPREVERTVAVYVQLPGGKGRIMGDARGAAIQPLTGSADQIADGLRAYARIGVAEVQLVVDPITLDSIDQLAPVLERLDRG